MGVIEIQDVLLGLAVAGLSLLSGFLWDYFRNRENDADGADRGED